MYPYKHQFLTDIERSGDGLRFSLSDNRESFPWRCLPFRHPALAGKLSFFTGITSGEVLFRMPPETASALTHLRWENLGDSDDWPLGGMLHAHQSESRFKYDADFLDGDGKRLQRLQAEGVAFQTRNFGKWREQVKEQGVPAATQVFHYSQPETAGVARKEECFVTGLGPDLGCKAMVDAKSGFVPIHPWHTGTGDHVNAGQLLDVVWQVTHLIAARQGWWAAPARLICVRGDAQFRNFMELGLPFEIAFSGSTEQGMGRILQFALSQWQKPCAVIELTVTADLPQPE